MVLLGRISKIIGRISDVFGYIALVGLFFLLLVIFTEIVLRSFFLVSLEFNITISMWLLVFLVWMGTAWTLKCDGHINVTLISSRLSRRAQIWLSLLSAIVGLTCMAIFSWNAWELCFEHLASGATDQSVWHIPKWYAWVPFSLGSTALVCQFLGLFFNNLNRLKTPS